MVVFKSMISLHMVKNYKVVVQAEDAYRQNAEQLNMLAVRNSKGLMVPVSNYITKEQNRYTV